jgi:hypothetical protein
LDVSKGRDAALPSKHPLGAQGAAAVSVEEQCSVPPLGCIQVTRTVESGYAGVSIVSVGETSRKSWGQGARGNGGDAPTGDFAWTK